MTIRQTFFALAGAGAIALQSMVLMAIPAHAQEQAAQEQAAQSGPIILVIDVQRILRESLAAKSVRSQLEARRNKLRKEFTKLEDELRTAERELVRQRTVLAPEAFQEKRQAYEKRVAAAQRMFDTSRRNLDRAFSTALKEIQTAIIRVGQVIAIEMNADLVMARSQVMFVNKNYDVTGPVLEQLNEKLPSVTLSSGELPLKGGAAAKPAKGAAPAPAPAK